MTTLQRALMESFSTGAGAAEARRCGVDRIELRFVDAREATTRVTNGVLDLDEREARVGLGVRAIVRGASGYAARALDAGATHIESLVAETIAAALDAVRAAPVPCAETEEEPARGSFETPWAEDPWAVGDDARLALLVDASRRLHAHAGSEARVARAHATLHESECLFATSDGTFVAQRFRHATGGLSLTVEHDGEREDRTRSVPFGGYEVLRALAEHAAELAEEARALVRAPRCPSESTSVIIGPEQLGRQLHDTVGRPLAGDRVLAGTSFVTPTTLGRLRYGSTAVNIVADARVSGAVGTFGWDDEGVAAQRTPLVQRGQLVGVLSTRRVAAQLGLTRSAGCARAVSYLDEPNVRMTNLMLEPDPRGPTLEELIADTAHGVLIGPSRGATIDERALTFEYACELAWEIRHGKRTRLLRRPMYRGRTPAFFGACELVCGPADLRVHGLADGSGDGQPVGILAPHARFRGVEIGAAR